MSEESENLDIPETGAVILNGAGAVRSYGTTVHAWVARMPYINDGGIVFFNGVATRVSVSLNGPLYIEDKICGRMLHGSRSSDGHYIVRSEAEELPKWMLRNDCGYAIPEYEPKTLKCPRCGVAHRRHSTPCECIFLSPALILNDVLVVGLRIYKRRCDDYIKAERERLLDWMFTPVMPTAPHFMPGFKHARTTKILEESTNTKLPESS